MRKLTSGLVAAVALLALPHMALAQRGHQSSSSGPKNEIGVDLGAAYSHVGSGCTADCSGMGIGTPVDVRRGFPEAIDHVQIRIELQVVATKARLTVQREPGLERQWPLGDRKSVV